MENDRHIVTLTVKELQDAITFVVKAEIQAVLPKAESSNSELQEITELLVPRQDLAKMFGISTVSLDKWKRAGLLPKAIKMAGRVYYMRNEIMEMIEKRKK